MGGGGGGQHCSVLVARRQRGELATEGNEGDEREKATERDESNGTGEENERERESRRRSETCLVEELGLERGRRARGLKGEKDGWRRAKMGRRRLRSP